MIERIRTGWGRAYGLALIAVALMSVGFGVVLVAFFRADVKDWSALAEIAGAFFLAVGGTATFGQAAKAASELPGRRQYDPGAPGRVRVTPDTDTPEAS